MDALSDYKRKLRAQKNLFWWAAAIFAMAAAFHAADMRPGVLCMAALFAAYLVYALVAVIRFRKFFVSYWESQGWDRTAINAEWNREFPPLSGIDGGD